MLIQFIGLKDFDLKETEIIKTLSAEYYEKISRDIQNAKLILDLKKYKKDGEKSKYALHSRIESGRNLALISKASDWDLKRTLHKLFQKLEHELQHKTKY